jgi:acyl carrier protein
MSNIKLMTFEEFKTFLSDIIGIAPVAIDRDTHFMGDLAVDSLKLVEMILQFELELGIEVPTDAAWEIQTVGDAYNYYIGQAQSASTSSV